MWKRLKKNPVRVCYVFSQNGDSGFYRSPIKLKEGYVISCVCQFTWGSLVTITHDALDLTMHGSSPGPGPSPSDPGPVPLAPPANDIWWQRLATYSNLFTWGPPSCDIFWPRPETCLNLFTWGPSVWCWHLVATVAHTMGEWAVHIILGCFLDVSNFEFSPSGVTAPERGIYTICNQIGYI